MTIVIYFKSDGDFEQPVVGESSYQSALHNIRESEGKIIEVDLQLEDENQFDKNAVLVAFGLDTLGYLSHEDAVIYRNALQKIGHPKAVGVCKAKITGGDGRHYGIILDIAITNPQVDRISTSTPSISATQAPQPVQARKPAQPQKPPKNSFTKNIADFWNKGLINKVVLLFVTLIISCCCFSAAISALNPNAPAAPAPTPDLSAIGTEAIRTIWAPLTQTAEALPTNTATPESTPTNTPPPTATPAPIVLTGSGDMIVDVPDGGMPRVLHAKYASGSNFIITSYDANNQPIDLLVNTIGAYDGKVPLDLLDDELTSRLEVKASGPWEITLIPLEQARLETMPSTIQGNGDDVIILKGGNADLIIANASNATSNFIIFTYSQNGIDLVFNEIAPYSGTALIDSSTFLIVVKAEGNWSLEITTK